MRKLVSGLFLSSRPAFLCGRFVLCVAMLLYGGGTVFPQAVADFEKPYSTCPNRFQGDPSISVLASDNETIFLSTREFIAAVNAADLSVIWSTPLAGSYKAAGQLTRSELLLVAADESKSELLTVSKETGLVQARVSIPSFNASSRPKIRSIGAINLLFDDDGSVVAFTKGIEGPRWSSDFGEELLDIEAADNNLRLLFRKKLLMVSPENGAVLSEEKLLFTAAAAQTLGPQRLLTGSADGNLVLWRNSGPLDRIWGIRTGGRITSLTRNGSNVLVTSFDNFAYFFDVDDGTLTWKKRVGSRVTREPLIVGEVAVISDSLEGAAIIVDLRNGRTINKLRGADGVAFTGPAVFVASRFFFSTNNGLVVFSSNGCRG